MPVAVAIAVLGVAFGGFDAVVVRPAMLSFARTGRRATGTVFERTGMIRPVPPRRSRSAIEVDDTELGLQLVDGSGNVAADGREEVLCSTPAGRCERLALVTAYSERWPYTPNMMRAVMIVAVAAIVAAVARWRRAPA